MNVDHDEAVSRIAAAIGERTRARMLYSLADRRGRTATELAMLAGVTPSTASVHLKLLAEQKLVNVFAQGKHRYFSLNGDEVAAALEALGVLAGSRESLITRTPRHLRAARTCYDHLAGTLGVLLHDRMCELGWFAEAQRGDEYDLTAAGFKGFEALGIDVDAARGLRRRFAFACLDWSERRSHLAGALGAALLRHALKRHWVRQNLDSRVLSITRAGRGEILARFGLREIPV